MEKVTWYRWYDHWERVAFVASNGHCALFAQGARDHELGGCPLLRFVFTLLRTHWKKSLSSATPRLLSCLFLCVWCGRLCVLLGNISSSSAISAEKCIFFIKVFDSLAAACPTHSQSARRVYRHECGGEYHLRRLHEWRILWRIRSSVLTAADGHHQRFARYSIELFLFLSPLIPPSPLAANTYCDLFTLSQDGILPICFCVFSHFFSLTTPADFHSVLSDFPEFENLIKREGLRPVVSKFKIYPELCSITYSVTSPRSGMGSASPAPGAPPGAAASPLLDIFVSKLQPRMVAEGRAIFRTGTPSPPLPSTSLFLPFSLPLPPSSLSISPPFFDNYLSCPGMSTREDGGIFFISKGTVVLQDEDDSPLFTKVENQHFGHYAVIRNERRTLSAHAVTECQVLPLPLPLPLPLSFFDSLFLSCLCLRFLKWLISLCRCLCCLKMGTTPFKTSSPHSATCSTASAKRKNISIERIIRSIK